MTRRIPIVVGDGEMLDATDGTRQSFDPATGRPIAEIACAGECEVDLTVAAARAALESGAWRRPRPYERGRIMQRIGALIFERRDEPARLESSDSGKPLRDAYREVDGAARNIEYYGGYFDKMHGSSIPLGPGWMDWTAREPLGVSLRRIRAERVRAREGPRRSGRNP